MPCSYKTAKGKPCQVHTIGNVCHIHKRYELQESTTNKVIEKYRDSIVSSINEQAQLQDTIDELNKENQDLKDKLDILTIEMNQLRVDVEAYNQIRSFEKLYNDIKEICDTDKLSLIHSHLKLKYARSRNQIKD